MQCFVRIRWQHTAGLPTTILIWLTSAILSAELVLISHRRLIRAKPLLVEANSHQTKPTGRACPGGRYVDCGTGSGTGLRLRAETIKISHQSDWRLQHCGRPVMSG